MASRLGHKADEESEFPPQLPRLSGPKGRLAAGGETEPVDLLLNDTFAGGRNPINGYLGDPPLAMAVLDRLVDGGIVLKLTSQSYRAHRAKQLRPPTESANKTSSQK